MAETFTNWSGSVKFTPADRKRPNSVGAVSRLVRRARRAGEVVRPVGSGHSSQPLFATQGTLVSLDRLSGVTGVSGNRAEVLPGTSLRELGEQLAGHGLAMENLGDVDYQSIAGALGTATHGSGITLGNLSSTLVGGTLVNGLGDEVNFGKGPDLLRAARVSLGALGIMTSLVLRVEEAHELHRQNWMTHIDWVLDNYAELVADNRSMDFYWYPRSDLAQVRMLNKPGEEPELKPEGRLKKDITGTSYEIIPNDRHLHFEEMEYMLPFSTGLEVFRQVRERVKTRHRATVGWRVLVRTIAPDDAMLSNTGNRETMTIALLQNNTLPYREYFRDMEPLFREAGGLPHWGKKHSLHGEELAELYPEWEDFRRVRREMDPDGVFLNDYLRELGV